MPCSRCCLVAPGCWVARGCWVPTPVLATALMPTMQSHKLFSPRVSFELAFASIAGEPQGYPSVFASKDACWPRRVFHRWAAFGRTNCDCLRQNQLGLPSAEPTGDALGRTNASPHTRGPTPSGTRNFWEPLALLVAYYMIRLCRLTRKILSVVLCQRRMSMVWHSHSINDGASMRCLTLS